MADCKCSDDLPEGQHWSACRIASLEAERDRLRAELAECKEALRDCASGLRYIADTYGKLYGVGWERALGKAKRAITGQETSHER